jgi:hypothetical protein
MACNTVTKMLAQWFSARDRPRKSFAGWLSSSEKVRRSGCFIVEEIAASNDKSPAPFRLAIIELQSKVDNWRKREGRDDAGSRSSVKTPSMREKRAVLCSCKASHSICGPTS